jgi:hypothetical protein
MGEATVKMIMRAAMLALVLVAAGSAFARSDVRDGNAMVKPQGADKYSIDGFTMGKAELFGYISELKETQSATGIVLKSGGNDEQRRVVGSIARTLQLKAFEQDGRELKSIDLPPEAATPAPPPLDDQQPVSGQPPPQAESAEPEPAPAQ